MLFTQIITLALTGLATATPTGASKQSRQLSPPQEARCDAEGWKDCCVVQVAAFPDYDWVCHDCAMGMTCCGTDPGDTPGPEGIPDGGCASYMPN